MRAALLTAALLSTPAEGLAEGGANYSVRPSEVQPPEGVALGQYQRTIRPFENWTLVCDETISAKTMVCNVTQTIEDEVGNLVFSWSLAATEGGKPYMILRTASVMPSEGLIDLKFEDRASPVRVQIDGCNEAVCIGMVPVGPIMRGQIAKRSSPQISYPTRTGSTVTVQATLAGLSDALSSIE